MECLTYNTRNYYQDRQQICQLLINYVDIKFRNSLYDAIFFIYKLVKQKLKIERSKI